MFDVSNGIVRGNLRVVKKLIANEIVGNLTGNASSASKLQTAKTFTVGNASKTFDGTDNVVMTLNEIGAAPAVHTHEYLPLSGGTLTSETATGLEVKTATDTDGSAVKYSNNKGVLGTVGFDATGAFDVAGTNGSVFTVTADGDGTIVGDLTANSFTGNLTGNADSATKLQTARNITVGNASKAFDGTAPVAFTLKEIGAAEEGHTHNYAGSTTPGGAADAVANSIAIKLNGGSTEGTDMFTFDGSEAKSINITPDAVGAAAAKHTHTASDITGTIPASKIEGVLDLANIPKGAQERLVVVESIEKMLALTTDDVQIGDVVKVADPDDPAMYYVKDDTNLGDIASYEIYATGAASSVPWTGVTGKPETFTPSEHNHVVADITDFPTTMKNPTAITIKLNGGSTEGTDMFTYDGSNVKSINITPDTIGAAAKEHGTHVIYGDDAPLVASETASAGVSEKVARADHVHPVQTSVSGNAGTATKLAAPVNIVVGEATKSFDGSKAVSFTLEEMGAAAKDHGKHVTFSEDAPLVASETASTGSSEDVARADHVHPVQTSVSGNAGTATKLETARTIKVGNATKEFDGSADIEMSLADIGAAASSHTHKYAGSATAGGAANSVANSIVVKLNGGTTEGSNHFTFDGSEGKELDITPAGIGAAAADHGKHVTFSDDAPQAAGNASTGSSEDVARADHVHPVQTSVSGNAGTATKLETARDITVGNATKSFDGTEAITFTLEEMGAAAKEHGTHVIYGDGAALAAAEKASAGVSEKVSRADHVHPLQTTVSGNAGSATKLETARTINGVTFDGSTDINNYASCTTAADTAAKVVAVEGFTLATGAEVTVKFTVSNTAENPTLNVNGTGAKAIYYHGAAVPAAYLAANETLTLRYNGTQYEIVGDLNASATITNVKDATKKAYLLGTSQEETGQAASNTFDTGVYLGAEAGTIVAEKKATAPVFSFGEAQLEYDSKLKCINFVFA